MQQQQQQQQQQQEAAAGKGGGALGAVVPGPDSGVVAFQIDTPLNVRPEYFGVDLALLVTVTLPPSFGTTAPAGGIKLRIRAPLAHAQLGSNRPLPEQGILVVWAFFLDLAMIIG